MEKRILIVDDEPRMTKSFESIFKNKGFFVQTSGNGYDAIKLFKQNPFKVVLSDIQMDGMNGIELMHKLKQIDPFVQIIFLTGHASIENATAALKQNNAFDYLQKPIENLSHLFQIIEEAAKRYDELKDQASQKSEDKKWFAIFRQIFDSLEAMVYVSDMETYELIYVNKKFLDTFGYDNSMVVEGQKCWQVIQKDQSKPCSFCTNKQLVNKDGTPCGPYEWEFQNTLNHRWYTVVDKAVEWYDKRIVRLETACDITDKKEHEKLFREFEKAVEASKSKRLESFGTLAGGVAHDYNNSLSAIIGNINLAQLTCLDNRAQKYLKTAEKGIMQAKNISSKLTFFAKGTRPLKVKTDLEKLILQTLEKSLDPEKVAFSFQSDKVPGSFLADPDQLELALENILQNSVESMEGMGKIDVTVRSREEPGPPRISISISDSGRGIRQELLDMIFNPYYTTKPLDHQKSKGLGLSIAWSVITRHGGSIKAESVLRKGTTIRIFLPVSNSKS